MAYGYQQGQPFGDPNQFTRSTQESELDRFNQFMRSQPGWAQARQAGPKAVERWLTTLGITVPKDFHIDAAGNLNQKSRTKRNILIGAGIAGAAIGAPALIGALGAGGGAGAAGAASSAAGALPATSLATGSAAMGGGLGLGAGLAPSLAPGVAAGTAAAAPTLGRILSTANQISGPLSALSSGRQYGYERDAVLQQRQQQIDQDAPLNRARQAVRGDELANMQDFQWGPPQWIGPIPVPTSTGGRRPSILSPQTRELGRQMSQDALNQQRNPPGLPKRSRWDSILDNAAMYSSLLGSFYKPKVA